MNSYSRELLRRASLIKQDVLRFATEWKRFHEPNTDLASYPIGYVVGEIQPAVIDCCDKLMRIVPPQGYEVYPRRRTLEAYAEYLAELTQGKYNPTPLLTIDKFSYYGVESPNLNINELTEALSKATDIATIVIYVTESNGKTYRRQKRTDVIPKKLIADFNKNGGMEMVETLYDGFSVEDIIGGFN